MINSTEFKTCESSLRCSQSFALVFVLQLPAQALSPVLLDHRTTRLHLARLHHRHIDTPRPITNEQR